MNAAFSFRYSCTNNANSFITEKQKQWTHKESPGYEVTTGASMWLSSDRPNAIMTLFTFCSTHFK